MFDNENELKRKPELMKLYAEYYKEGDEQLRESKKSSLCNLFREIMNGPDLSNDEALEMLNHEEYIDKLNVKLYGI